MGLELQAQPPVRHSSQGGWFGYAPACQAAIVMAALPAPKAQQVNGIHFVCLGQLLDGLPVV
jgi:hypothetical protein